MDCDICFNRFNDDSYSTLCGHVFCKKCIDEAVLRNASCPACLKVVRTEDVHRIFLSNVNHNDSVDDLFENQIMVTRIADLEIAINSTKEQTKLVIAKTDQLSLNFSKIDTDNAKILKENEELKRELNDIKMMLKHLKTDKTTTVDSGCIFCK